MARRYHSPAFESCKPIITEIITTWQAEEKEFDNITQLIRELLPHLTQHTDSESSVRRYLKRMNFVFHSSISYGFDSNTAYFSELVTYLGCQSHICFLLEKPTLGTFFAEKLNDYYSSPNVELEYFVHCVAIQDLLVCFYKINKDRNVNRNRLKTEIPKLLSEYYFSKNE